MTREAICELCRPHFPDLVHEIREAFSDFDEMLNSEYRATVLAARAKLTSCRMNHRIGQRYGRDPTAPIRIQEVGGMDILVIEGGKFNVGLRFKKLKSDYLTCNHRSEQQDGLRRSGQFETISLPGFESPPLAHVFMGYRCTPGIQSRLLDIALTVEDQSRRGRYFIVWHHVVWTPNDDFSPPQTFTTPLFPPPEPTYTIKPKRSAAEPKPTGTEGVR